MRFSRLPVLPGSAEAQVTSGDTVKPLLIAYFIGNISAKKILNSVHVHQSYSKPKGGTFFETRCINTLPFPFPFPATPLQANSRYMRMSEVGPSCNQS